MHRAVLYVLAAVLLTATTALSADELLLGRKLLMKSPPSGPANNKVVHLAKDPSITLGAAGGVGDPQCTGSGGGGGSLRLLASGGSGDVTIPLPCAGWTTNAANTLYKYTDPTGATCKLVLVKGGVLAKAVCKGAQVAIDINGTMSPVAVVTMLNTESYCTEFGGTLVKDGTDSVTFLGKDASAPASCSTATPTTSTTNTTVTPTPSTTSTIATPTTSTTSTTFQTCGDSVYPTCGGACPSGQVCQAHMTQSCSLNCMPSCSPTGTECLCVPSAGTCDGYAASSLCGGTDRPFTYGPCASGEVCIDNYVGSFIAGRFCF